MDIISLWLLTFFLVMTIDYPFSSNNTLKCCRQLTCLFFCVSSSPNMSVAKSLPYFQTSYQFTYLPLNLLQFAFLFKHMIAPTEHSIQ